MKKILLFALLLLVQTNFCPKVNFKKKARIIKKLEKEIEKKRNSVCGSCYILYCLCKAAIINCYCFFKIDVNQHPDDDDEFFYD